jgi:hypothetical protein
MHSFAINLNKKIGNIFIKVIPDLPQENGSQRRIPLLQPLQASEGKFSLSAGFK